jgi:Spy/CpxP family protein refolding chaperone
MKTITKTLLISGALLATGAATVNAVAGGSGPCGHRSAHMGHDMGGAMRHSPERMLGRISDRLDLSDQQEADIRASFGKDAEQMKDLRRQMADNRAALLGLDPRNPAFTAQHGELAAKQAALMQQMMQLRASRKAEIATVLTKDQYARWQEMREKFGKHGRRFGRHEKVGEKQPNPVDES